MPTPENVGSYTRVFTVDITFMLKYLTIIPRARMASEWIAHEVQGIFDLVKFN